MISDDDNTIMYMDIYIYIYIYWVLFLQNDLHGLLDLHLDIQFSFSGLNLY
jgi:hypothetical protein